MLSHFSLDSVEGGQRMETAKYKTIENSKFLSNRHPFNSKFIGGVDITFELWMVAQLSRFKFSTLTAEPTDRRRGGHPQH